MLAHTGSRLVFAAFDRIDTSVPVGQVEYAWAVTAVTLASSLASASMLAALVHTKFGHDANRAVLDSMGASLPSVAALLVGAVGGLGVIAARLIKE